MAGWLAEDFEQQQLSKNEGKWISLGPRDLLNGINEINGIMASSPNLTPVSETSPFLAGGVFLVLCWGSDGALQYHDWGYALGVYFLGFWGMGMRRFNEFVVHVQGV